jgi:hypothetical protein
MACEQAIVVLRHGQRQRRYPISKTTGRRGGPVSFAGGRAPGYHREAMGAVSPSPSLLPGILLKAPFIWHSYCIGLSSRKVHLGKTFFQPKRALTVMRNHLRTLIAALSVLGVCFVVFLCTQFPWLGVVLGAAVFCVGVHFGLKWLRGEEIGFED